MKNDINKSEKYKPEWESLIQYQEEKEWLKDAKFGIYTHWGPATYPTSLSPVIAGWYARRMYEKSFSEARVFEHHKKVFGDQNDVGYKDLIPLFKAENFNPEEWVSLFKKAGAKFAGPVAVHHDNFCMWNSSLTRWNSVEMGPKRDVCGEIEKAVRAEGMKFFMSMHHAGAWNFYVDAYDFDAKDPQYADLYTERHKAGDPVTEAFADLWFKKVKEVIDKYSPDALYFDHCMGRIPEQSKMKMAAYTYNKAVQRDQDFILLYKHGDLEPGSAMLDYEVYYPTEKTDHFWLTDWSVTNWFPYSKSIYTYPVKIIHRMIDIVSKNGALLLNVPPDHTGIINDQSKNILSEIGEWLEVNGKAIYETRPWKIFGIGPNLDADAGEVWKEGTNDSIFVADDIRFTQSKDGNTIYAIALGWPENGHLVLEPLCEYSDRIKQIRLLGHSEDLKWRKSDNAIVIELPDSRPSKYALACSISLT